VSFAIYIKFIVSGISRYSVRYSVEYSSSKKLDSHTPSHVICDFLASATFRMCTLSTVWTSTSIQQYQTQSFLHLPYQLHSESDGTRVCKSGRLFQTQVLGSGLGLLMTGVRATLRAWQQSSLSGPSHHPTVSLPIHRCQTFSCARALSAACTTPTIRNWTPESDWKHKKTSSINCKLQTKADWKPIFPVSYSYRHQSSLITYIAKLQQSVTQSARKSLSFFFFKISSQKSSIN